MDKLIDRQAELKVAVFHYLVMSKASERMEAEVEAAPKKMGAIMRYRHMIPARVWDGAADWFDLSHDEDQEDGRHWHIGAMAIAFDMKDRLISLASKNNIDLVGAHG